MNDADIVVVGAGLSGLAAARDLVAAGRSVRVLEARDRVGGRTLSRVWQGATVDLGAQWIGPGQPRVAALARSLGRATFPTYVQGERTVHLGSSVSREASHGGASLAGLVESLGKAYVDRLAARVPPEDPARCADAVAWDALPLSQWRDGRLPPGALRGLFDVAVRTVFGADAAEISLLYFLWYLRTGNGLGAHVDVTGGAQERRFVDGAQSLSLDLAAALGDRVRCGCPVQGIAHDDAGVTVHLAGGETVRGSRAVVAVPPGHRGRIVWTPGLDRAMVRRLDRMPMGATVKVVVAYAEAFWRGRGWSGEVVSGHGPVSYCVDNGSLDGALHALLCFVVGPAAVAWTAMDTTAREAAVIAQLVRWFGDAAGRPRAVLSYDWADDPWAGGCPVSNPAPGMLTHGAASLRAPAGRVHFAGTETATVWVGYLEGALEAGERAAREVLAAG